MEGSASSEPIKAQSTAVGTISPGLEALDQGLLIPVEASTLQAGAEPKGRKKANKSASHSSKNKKALKSASKFEKRKDKTLDKLCSKAASQKPHSSSFKGEQASNVSSRYFQLSPIRLQEEPGPFSPLFPINTSGLWGAGTDL